ncbi:amidase [Mesorhizobium sp. BAC0120]|uniref:amidase n=1 Tax=Mesorhizobium sp. BAC0120 TaxID=3090670 RepID=UPI00298D53BD|nr:amidase [Mesorhizobium sp. BAC0120]MDW6026104.1 amidase [Mesorhizobium sp. BAC0120]
MAPHPDARSHLSPLPRPSELCRFPATALARMIAERQVSASEVVAAYLDRIDEVNGTVNAIVSLRSRGQILAEAKAADAAQAAGVRPGPLHGLPIAIKDLAQTKGLRTTFGSRIFADFVPEEDSYFVSRMRDAGAIIIGKTNVPEFGFGSQTYNDVFGATRNAFDPRLSSGGSSGGAAVALALHMVPLADGSDLCGSLRNPAGWNNVFGFRTSPGRVAAGPSTELYLSQMSVEGPMARSVADLALLLGVQAGYDPRSPLSLDGDFRSSAEKRKEMPWRIAWLGDLGGHLPMEDGVLDACESALRGAEAGSFRIEPVIPDFDYEGLWEAFVMLRHASSGMSLKIHYDDAQQRELLKPEAIWEIEGGLSLTAPQIYAASTVRSAWYKTVLSLFERYDLLALPTAQVFAFDAELHWPAEIAGRGMDSYHRWMEVTALATMAGCPAIAVPAGFDVSGRSMGIQLIGRPRADAEVLSAAASYEQVCGIKAGA